ncbi:MAG: hypothetical protein JWR50_2252 [Mucilaginibacter sp.]|nr:hypothetical protein [Mucilaginibacter sp.]
MKVILQLVTALLLIAVSQAHAQINNDMQTMRMIKDFYTAYSSLNFKSADINKLDSLIDKYLTPEEGRKVKEGYKKGYDLITNNNGINKKSLETMTIQTISDKKSLNIETGKYEIIKGVKNAYEVSYLLDPTITTQPPIVVDVLVVKHDGSTKISFITNNLTYYMNTKNKKTKLQ